MDPRKERLLNSFRRRARSVRLPLALTWVATGLTAGLLLACVAAAVAWLLSAGQLRLWAAGFALLGALAGWAWGWRSRWSDGLVALYLDRRLGTQEALATALALEEADAAYGAVVERAQKLLDEADRPVRPRVWRHFHAAGPLAAAAIIALNVVPLPTPPAAAAPPPGAEEVIVGELESLEQVIALEELDAYDDAQRQRLRELAERARKLQEGLREGMPKREAQDAISKLRDDVAAERQRFGSGDRRRGLEAAIGKLAEEDALAGVRRALGDRDLTRLDAEMQKLAAQLEEADREAAREALKKAAEAARREGAHDVADELERQAESLESRAEKHKALSALGKAMASHLSEDGQRALQEFANGGESLEELADALNEALEGLTDEELQQLAENMAEGMEGMEGMQPGQQLSPEQLEALREQLQSEAGRQALKEQLRQWAQGQRGEAQRQQALGDAERGLADAQLQLGMTPVPGPGQPGNMPGGGSGQSNDGPPGVSRGGGPGNHDGFTDPIDGDAVRAHARTQLNPGAPNPGTVMGRAPGRAGETANKAGTGELGVVAPGEVGGIERSEVPEEYREQVGRYFQP